MMSAKRKWMLSALALLLVLNLGRWLLPVAPLRSASAPNRPTALHSLLSVPVFEIPAPETPDTVRDLFALEALAQETIAPTSAPTVVEKKPEPSQAQLQKRADRRAMQGIRLAGMTHHDGRWEAFISFNTETFVARKGDRIAGRYRIVKVSEHKVVLKDNKTGTMRTLSLNER